MKNFARTFLPLVSLVCLGTSCLHAEEPAATPPAQPSGERREHRDEMRENFKRMVKELNLTADQQIQAEAIHKQAAEEMKALRNDASLNEDQKRAKGRDLRKSTEDQIRAILTPEQQAKAKEMREKHGHRGPDDRPPGEAPPSPPPAK